MKNKIRRIKWIKYHWMKLTLTIGNRFLRCLLREKISTKLSDWINQGPIFVINPSMPQQKHRLPTVLVERALAIVQEGRLPVDRITVNDTYSLMQECIAAIQLIQQRLENLERGVIGDVTVLDVVSGSEQYLETEDQFEIDTGEIDLEREGSQDQLDEVDAKKSNLLKKPSMRSELDEIKRMLSTLKNKDD